MGAKRSHEPTDVFPQFGDGAGSIEDNVRKARLPRKRHLIVNASKSLTSGEAVSLPETSDLCLSVCGDDDDGVDACIDAGFK
jgi:hypothetical protein